MIVESRDNRINYSQIFVKSWKNHMHEENNFYDNFIANLNIAFYKISLENHPFILLKVSKALYLSDFQII